VRPPTGGVGRPPTTTRVLPTTDRQRCRSHNRRRRTLCQYWPKRVCSVAVTYRSTGCRRARVFFVSAAFAFAVCASVEYFASRCSPFSRSIRKFNAVNGDNNKYRHIFLVVYDLRRLCRRVVRAVWVIRSTTDRRDPGIVENREKKNPIACEFLPNFYGLPEPDPPKQPLSM